MNSGSVYGKLFSMGGRQNLLKQAMLAVLTLFSAIQARADALPYTTRTLPYSGYSTTIRGDLRTIGMAGATVGLADSLISAFDNPAGLAMTVKDPDLNITNSWVRDAHLQNLANSIQTYNYGLAASLYPWGFSAAIASSYREGQPYTLPTVTGDTPELAVLTREVRLSGARLFFENRLSIGATLILGQAERSMLFPTLSNLNHSDLSYAVGGAFGATVQLNKRVLLGASYTLPMTYPASSSTNTSGTLAGFYQPIKVPARFGFGIGWVPNRFFKLDFTFYNVGSTPDAALLKDETALVGQYSTFQPRLGAAYQWADFRELQSTFYAGSYIETTRIAGTPERMHVTGGVEFKPWIFFAGAGFDLSAGYQNLITGFGIDVGKVLEKLDAVPRAWRPPAGGWFPSPTYSSDEGLARPLVKNWQPHGPKIDPIRVGLDIPKKLGEKAADTGSDIVDAFSDGIGLDEPKKNKQAREALRRAQQPKKMPQKPRIKPAAASRK